MSLILSFSFLLFYFLFFVENLLSAATGLLMCILKFRSVGKLATALFMFAVSVICVKGFFIHHFHYYVNIFDTLLYTFIVCPDVAVFKYL